MTVTGFYPRPTTIHEPFVETADFSINMKSKGCVGALKLNIDVRRVRGRNLAYSYLQQSQLT